MNNSIKNLHTQLIRLVESLSNRLGKTADLQESMDLLREMQETNHRVIIAGQLLFHETTNAIKAQLTEVSGAIKDLQKSIARIEKARDVIKGVGKVLTAVDKALDAVKLM